MERLTHKTDRNYYIPAVGKEYSEYSFWDNLGKYEDLEEEIGCPLEEAIKVLQILKEKRVDIARLYKYYEHIKTENSIDIKLLTSTYNIYVNTKQNEGLIIKQLTEEEMQLIIELLK